MGGLTTALSLLRAGHKVLMFEQHEVPGGWAHSFIREGFKFSPGVHLVGHLHEGGYGRQVYEGLGVANDMLFFRQNPEGYDHNIVGNHHFRMPAGAENLEESLCKTFPKSRRGIRRYLKFSKQVFDELYIALEPKNSIADYVLLPWRTRHVGRMGWWKLRTILDFYIRDPLVKSHLGLQSGNHGLPPKRAPFFVHALVANHCMSGTYYPRGSGAGLVKAFTKNIKALGGEIRTSSPVHQILLKDTPAGKKATGIQLANGETYFAKNIVSNADPHNTFQNMVGSENISPKLTKKLGRTKYSTAVLNMFMVVDMDLRKAGMDSSNIWYASKSNLDQVYEESSQKGLFDDPVFPGLFISSPTLKDPVSFDGRHHTLEVVAIVNFERFQEFEALKYGARNEAYESCKRALEAKMIRTLEQLFPGISSRVKLLELGTPLTANHYVKSTRGNIYGPEKIFSQIGPNSFKYRTEIENLYLTGAATLSQGLVGAANSGIGTASTILNCKWDDLLQYGEGQNLRIYDAEQDDEWPESLKTKRDVRQKRLLQDI